MAAVIPFEEIILSDIFEFQVGVNRTSIKVNSKAISRLSPVLDKLMNGQMKEAREKCAVFKHLEVSDFARLCQFAYTGDYTSPQPAIDVTRSDVLTYNNYQPQAQTSQNFSNCYCQYCNRSSYCENSLQISSELSRKYNQIITSWDYRNYTVNEAQAYYTPPSNANNPKLNFGPLLLSHAVLYAFGEEYGIPDLKSLAIFRLYRVLYTMTLYKACLKDIVTLIGFVYDNTKDGSDDPLRGLVTTYAVKEHVQLNTCEEFRELLIESREFVADYLKIIMTLI